MLGVRGGIDSLASLPSADVIRYGDITVAYGDGDHYLVPSILDEKCHIQPGQVYNARAVDRTYEALARLGIIKSVNIDLIPLPVVDDVYRLDVVIYVTRNKKQGVTFELEGTNSEGDLGFGLGMEYRAV